MINWDYDHVTTHKDKALSAVWSAPTWLSCRISLLLHFAAGWLVCFKRSYWRDMHVGDWNVTFGVCCCGADSSLSPTKSGGLLIALNLPVWWTPSGIYGIEGPSEICTQSAEVRLAVGGAQPLFTLGLLMFALSLVDFLSLLLSPSTYFNIFYFCQKYHLNYTYKIFKKFHVGLKFEWGF